MWVVHLSLWILMEIFLSTLLLEMKLESLPAQLPTLLALRPEKSSSQFMVNLSKDGMKSASK